MKNALYYIVTTLLSLVLYTVLLAICVNTVLPIVLVLTRHGFWWLLLYLLEPVLICTYIVLNNLIEDL